MNIEPQVTLPLIYQLTDPFDSATYYVRAVIVDSLSNAVIDTKNLVSQGSGLYSSSIYAPADPLGTGRHIHVVISVYTDSGYSTYSDIYQKKIDKYLVKKTTPNFGGGGGVEVDYDKIKKMIENAVGSIQFPRADYSLIYERINAVAEAVDAAMNAVRGIKMPNFEQYASKIMEAIKNANSEVLAGIAGIEIPEQEKMDMSPVINALGDIKKGIESVSTLTSAAKEDIISLIDESIKKSFEVNKEQRKKVIAELMSEVGDAPAPIPKSDTENKPSPVKDYFDSTFVKKS